MILRQYSSYALRWRCEKCGDLRTRAFGRPEICRACGNTETGFKLAVVKVTVSETFWRQTEEEEFVRLVQ
jgi:ribosomal protein S27E